MNYSPVNSQKDCTLSCAIHRRHIIFSQNFNPLFIGGNTVMDIQNSLNFANLNKILKPADDNNKTW